MWQNRRCSILFHCVPCQGAQMSWVQIPPGNSRSSRKRPERIQEATNGLKRHFGEKVPSGDQRAMRAAAQANINEASKGSM